jgi:DNA-binding transcriptional MocR family regulator
MPRIVARSGYDIRGAIELRAIADRYSARGIPTDPSQIVVTTGAQSAIHLLSTVLVGRGDRVVIETPTYPMRPRRFVPPARDW